MKKLRIGILIVLLIAAMLGIVPQNVKADTQWFNLSATIEDTFVSEDAPDASPGEFPVFDIAQNESIAGKFRALLKWNTSAIPEGTVISANLSIFLDVNFDGGFGQSIGAYNNTAEWDELETTWNTKPTTAAEGDCGDGAMDYNDTVEEVNRMGYDVTDAVFLDALNNGITLCYFDEFGLPGEWQEFRSSDYLANPLVRPTLWVLVDIGDPAPIPSGTPFTNFFNFAWLLVFVATLTLTLIGAWTLKTKRR